MLREGQFLLGGLYLQKQVRDQEKREKMSLVSKSTYTTNKIQFFSNNLLQTKLYFVL